MNTINYLTEKGYTGFADISDMRKDLFKQKIMVSYEPLNEAKTARRVILSCVKTIRVEKFGPMQVECNGLVLEARKTDGKYEWRPLVIPCQTFKNNVMTKKTNGRLEKGLYDIYKANDGTTINLYYYGGKWTVATARSYEMNNVAFNNLTYEQMLSDVVSRAFDLTLDEFWTKLDQTKSYCIGFKHPDSQPFWEGVSNEILQPLDAGLYKMWLIHVVSLPDLTPDRVATGELDFVTRQELVKVPVKNMHVLYQSVNHALTNYFDCKVDEVCESAVNYGYLLISKDPSQTGDHSTIFLESKLLQNIREMWYHGTYTKYTQQNNYNRELTVLCYSYLDDTRAATFLRLFPQYQDRFALLAKIENGLAEDVLAANTTPSDVDVIKYLLAEVKGTLSLESDVYDDKLLTIKKIIHNVKHIDIYYQALAKLLNAAVDGDADLVAETTADLAALSEAPDADLVAETPALNEAPDLVAVDLASNAMPAAVV